MPRLPEFTAYLEKSSASVRTSALLSALGPERNPGCTRESAPETSRLNRSPPKSKRSRAFAVQRNEVTEGVESCDPSGPIQNGVATTSVVKLEKEAFKRLEEVRVDLSGADRKRRSEFRRREVP